MFATPWYESFWMVIVLLSFPLATVYMHAKFLEKVFNELHKKKEKDPDHQE